MKEFVIPDDMQPLLDQCCTLLDRAIAARKVIDAEGMTTFDRFNQQVPHPCIKIENDARGLFIRSFRQLNLADVTDPELLKLAKAR